MGRVIVSTGVNLASFADKVSGLWKVNQMLINGQTAPEKLYDELALTLVEIRCSLKKSGLVQII